MIAPVVLTPLLLLLATVPLGAALARLAGAPPLFAVPVGLSVLVLGLEGCRVVLGGIPGWVLPLAIVVGLVAFWATGAYRSDALLWWTLGAIVALYVVLTAPEWLAGRVLVYGYNHNNDGVLLTLLAQLISESREAIPPPYVTTGYFSYPAGSMDVTAAVASTLGRTAFDVTVPVMAVSVSMLLACIVAFLQRLEAPLLLRVGVPLSVLPIAGALPISYFASGASSSMAFLVPLLGTLLLSWIAVRDARPAIGALAGLCAGATLTVYGLSTLGWIAAFVGLLVAMTVAERGAAGIRPLLWVGAAAGAAGLLAFPGVVRAWRFQAEAAETTSGGLTLGNLSGPLNPLLTLGVDRDLAPALALPAFALAGLFLVAGIGIALTRPRPLVTLLLFACAVTPIYATLAGPYYVAKAMTPAGVVLVAVALWAALYLLSRARGAVLAALWVGVGVWVAGALYTGLTYLNRTPLSPAWLAQLEPTREAAAKRGATLVVTRGAQSWTAWALRDPRLRVSTLEGHVSEAPPELADKFQTIVVDPDPRNTPPGPPFRKTGQVGGLDIYTR